MRHINRYGKVVKKYPMVDNEVFNFDVKSVDGVNIYDVEKGVPWQAQNLVLESPEEGILYRLQRTIVDDVTNFDLVPADVLLGKDGKKWRLKVQLTDGVPNIAEPELVT